MRSNASDLRDWCAAEFPQIGSAATWLLKSDSVRFMPRDAYYEAIAQDRYDEVMAIGISEYREELRRWSTLR